MISGRCLTGRIPQRHWLVRLRQAVELAHVERAERSAQMKEEYAEQDRGDEDVEGHAQLDDERHAVGRYYGGKEYTALHGHEADHLRHRRLAYTHQQHAEQLDGDTDGNRIARRQSRQMYDRLRHIVAEDDKGHAAEQHQRRVLDRLSVVLHVKFYAEPVE